MTEPTRFERFQNNYNKAINIIQMYQADETMANITNWLLNTNINPHSFLDFEYAEQLESAEGFASLLDDIYHALVDDGDICFPVIGGEPRISFSNQHEFKSKEFPNNGSSRKQSALNGFLETIDDFIRECDANHVTQLRRWFILDAARFSSTEFAVEHYKSYKQFNTEWINDPEIETHREVWSKLIQRKPE